MLVSPSVFCVLLALLTIFVSKIPVVKSFRSVKAAVQDASTMQASRRLVSRLPVLISGGVRSPNRCLSSSLGSTTDGDSGDFRRKAAPQVALLSQLPAFQPPNEHLSRALTRSALKPDFEVKNAKQRSQKHASETIQALTKELCKPVKEKVDKWAYIKRHLSPFDTVVCDLVIENR